MRVRLPGAILLAVLGALPVRAALVISEIHYHPPTGEEALEFLEISNDSTTPEDISGYAFVEGIRFVIPPGTVLGARGILALCADAGAVQARYGIQNVLGDYDGRLDAGGERLTVVDHGGIVVLTIAYRDRGKWPAAPDGTGRTLVLRKLGLDPGEPESWTQSPEPGGSPGRPNFPTGEPEMEERVVLDAGSVWRYQKGTGPFSSPEDAWRTPDFDAGAWLSGPSPFGFGYPGASTVLVDMRNGYTSLAVLGELVLSPEELDLPGDFYLAVDYDDGFCSFLNGAEFVRSNCGAYGEERAWNAQATGVRDAGKEELFKIERRELSAGRNTIAIAGYNRNVANNDFFLGARIIHRRPLTASEPPPPPVTFNELFRGAAPGAGWVELHNGGPAPFDLSRHRLTDDPDRAASHGFPDGTSIPPGGFLVIEEGRVQAGVPSFLLSAGEVHLFLIAANGFVVAASVFDRPPPPGAVMGGYSELRFPDGGPLEWVAVMPTPGASNRVQSSSDIVLSEIFYHPPEERRGEFVELYNRGSAAVDVSGFRFSKGIDYTIAGGTIIEPGGYLVVAEDPGLIAEHYGYDRAQGPYAGQLANEGENVRLVDRAGNPVDEVRYHDGGVWPRWADGGGASLELLDPDQDNAIGAAWDASDETEKTAWEELSFPVPEYAPAAESELHLYLAERGVLRVDDVSIIRGGGPNLIPNPGFEAGTSPWVIQGTHVASRRTTADRRSGSASLEIVASGKGDTLVNRIEVETSPPMTAGPYDVSLWARWVRGASLLVVHGEYTQGTGPPATQYSGNTLSRGLHLTIPWNIGTPGRENSARRELREATGSGNLGPVIAGVRHWPPSPASGELVTVTAQVFDSQGVSSVVLFYALESALGGFDSIPLLDGGESDDGAAGDGLYGGELPRAPDKAWVVFYVEAADSGGAVTRFPRDAPERTCLYQAAGPAGEGFDAARIILDKARDAELRSRPLHSNDLLDGTFVFNDEDVYYNAGIRYRGSPWGRPGRDNYRVRLENDGGFLRGRRAINVDSSGDNADEGAVYFLVRRSSGEETPAPVGDYGYVRTWFNGVGSRTHSLHQPVDRDFVARWLGSADRALAFKVEGRRVFDDAPDPRLISLDGASFAYRGEDRENYRDYFIPALRRSVDEWAPLESLTRILDMRVTPDDVFDREIGGVLDVEAFLRVLIPRIVANDTDGFPLGAGHNGYLMFGGMDERWRYVGFDMDHTFGDQHPNPVSSPTRDPYVSRLLSRPGPRRLYYRLLLELMNGYGSPSVSGPYFDALQQATQLSTVSIKNFLRSAAINAQKKLEPFTSVPFRITTNSGREITTDQALVELEGEAPIQVAFIFYQRGGDGFLALEPLWTGPTAWRASFDLPEAENPFELLAIDSAGNLQGRARASVFSTLYPTGPIVQAIRPDRGPASGGTVLDLAGSGFADGMKVRFEGVESPQVEVLSPEAARVATPPAVFPLPPEGAVYVELYLSAEARTRLHRAFTYTLEGGFVRGDATSDSEVDLADPVAILFHLFQGVPLLCLDAADLDDDGRVNLTDVIAGLDYLFRAGRPPASPFPLPGSDATDDGLACPR